MSTVWSVAQNWDYVDVDEKYRLFDSLEQWTGIAQPFEIDLQFPDFDSDVRMVVTDCSQRRYVFYLTPHDQLVGEKDYLEKNGLWDTYVDTDDSDQTRESDDDCDW